jgi:hypothetical protein
LNVFSVSFYFIHQINSFYMISIFTTNTKIIFVFYFSMNFMFLENKIKVCSKFYKKIIFVNWSLYATIYKIIGSVKFYTDYRMYLVFHFILYIKFIHFVWFRYLQQIQILIFIYYFSMNFMFLENEIKVCSKFSKKSFP